MLFASPDNFFVLYLFAIVGIVGITRMKPQTAVLSIYEIDPVTKRVVNVKLVNHFAHIVTRADAVQTHAVGILLLKL
jgi:hypothetical protein